MTYTIHAGSNLDILPTLPDNSVDSIVTDPPYELGFMGKKWDNSGIAYSTELWTECLRVLKPGGHLLSFGGTRTWHRVAVAIEDSGFEVRDSIAWMYGSGFPKSLDVSKAIDKAAGAEREVVGKSMRHGGGSTPLSNQGVSGYADNGKPDITAASTPEAQQWQGWGTALKPAFEPIVVARKPLIGTVAANVLEHGTGALNIDGSRIEGQAWKSVAPNNGGRSGGVMGKQSQHPGGEPHAQGRWPANVILDAYSAGILDEQSGNRPSAGTYKNVDEPMKIGTRNGNNDPNKFLNSVYLNSKRYNTYANEQGGASRFFYVAKASKRDRNEGLEGLEAATAGEMVDRVEGSAGMNSPRAGAGRTAGSQNFHPTVKPTTLMRYLVKLVTPPNGVVLDPFTGSGSTGKAAILEGFDFIGIELTEEYLPIIQGRLKHAEKVANEDRGLF